MKVYAFEWCDCIYESSYAVRSLHTTLRGAYLAMRSELLARYEEESTGYIRMRKLRGFPKSIRRPDKCLEHEKWRCVVLNVLDN